MAVNGISPLVTQHMTLNMTKRSAKKEEIDQEESRCRRKMVKIDHAAPSQSSSVYFELTGDNGSTGQRQLDIGRKDTLRKGTIDSYIMRTSRYILTLEF